ncbi:MAG: hypothetical protein KA712_09360 [Myxococcales bacterium]|nr:hypothetical protein [Myxococcales bacterium]
MADVDREEPVLQGVVQSLPSPMGSGGVRAAAGGKEVDEVSEVSMEGLQGSLDETPGEPTMLGSIEAIEAALEAQSRSAHLDLGSEDRTVIAPTPIPPESDDRTNPTADAQILEAQPEEAPPMMPLHPAAQTYGMAALAARAQPGPFGARLRKVLGKPVSLSALQLGLLVVASGLFGAVLARGGEHESAPTVHPAATQPPRASAPEVVALPTPVPPPEPPAAKPAPVQAAAPLGPKKKADKKLAGAEPANLKKATR